MMEQMKRIRMKGGSRFEEDRIETEEKCEQRESQNSDIQQCGYQWEIQQK